MSCCFYIYFYHMLHFVEVLISFVVKRVVFYIHFY